MSIQSPFFSRFLRNTSAVLLLGALAAPGCAVDDRLRVDMDRATLDGTTKRDNLKKFLGTLEPNDVVMVFNAEGKAFFFDGETLEPAERVRIEIEPYKTEFLNPIDLRFVRGSCTVTFAMPGQPLRTYKLSDDHPFCK